MVKTTEVYTFTGFYPSGNSCKWHFDKYRNTLFSNTIESEKWKKQPEIGDKVKKVRYDGVLKEVYINKELVYEFKE